ncbi:hypothetical protein C922_05695, partial [Plasmodium inui San Antonio 1]
DTLKGFKSGLRRKRYTTEQGALDVGARANGTDQNRDKGAISASQGRKAEISSYNPNSSNQVTSGGPWVQWAPDRILSRKEEDKSQEQNRPIILLNPTSHIIQGRVRVNQGETEGEVSLRALIGPHREEQVVQDHMKNRSKCLGPATSAPNLNTGV